MLQSDSVFGPIVGELNQFRYTAAMTSLVRLSPEYSNNLTFLHLLAQTQQALSDTNGLIKTLSVIATQTKAEVDYLALMLAFYAQGRLNEALDIALTLQEMLLSPSGKRALSHCLIKIYLEFNDYEGVQEIIAAYEGAEQDDLMLWAAGLLRLSAGEKNEALIFFRKSVSLNRTNDQAWVSLSLLHEEMGDRELALANLEKAFDANPNNTTGLKLLTRWHFRNTEQSAKVITKVTQYLCQHEFDEEISLCYMQLLKETQNFNSLYFEIEKLRLNNPTNPKYMQLKKNLEASMKTP